MGSSSMQVTIGSAIERARQAGHVVEILVDNHWLEGLIVEADGMGVILENAGRDRCVVRLERVSAVRVTAAAEAAATPPADLLADAAPAYPAPMPYAEAV
jgi:hypothetical protein